MAICTSPHPGFAQFSAAVILILGGGLWLFLGILEDVLSGDPLVTVDRMLHEGLQRFRAPLFDHVMVAASELGDTAVTVPVSLVVLATLLFRHEFGPPASGSLRSRWLKQAEASAKLIKIAVRRSRPVSIYASATHFCLERPVWRLK
ncbi:hypothetical protein [Paraburkholderia terrae]